MKPSAFAKSVLTEEKASEIFQACEQLVQGIKVGVTVPLELNIKDDNLIVDVVLDTVKAELSTNFQVRIERAIRQRASGLFKQWLIKKGRMV